MKRRNFLKLLALSPLALIVPKVFMSDWHVYDDAIPIIRPDPFPSNGSWIKITGTTRYNGVYYQDNDWHTIKMPSIREGGTHV